MCRYLDNMFGTFATSPGYRTRFVGSWRCQRVCAVHFRHVCTRDKAMKLSKIGLSTALIALSMSFGVSNAEVIDDFVETDAVGKSMPGTITPPNSSIEVEL